MTRISVCSSWRKVLAGALILTFIVGCQSLRTREEVQQNNNPRPLPAYPHPSQQQQQQPETRGENPSNLPPAVTEAPPPAPTIPAMPKIGIILGAGGAKTYAHIGFLQELAREKIPVTAIAGVEFAAPMAALYANKELANDVEWQMFKLKEDEVIKTSLLGSASKNNSVTQLKEFFQTSLARLRIEDFRIPFACPTYSLSRNQELLVIRGPVESVLYPCLAYPPYFKPYGQSVAGVREITSLANYLRQKGANYIVFVNVLQPPGGHKAYVGDPASTDNVLWSEIAGLYNRPLPGVDSVISLDTSAYDIVDFDKRRDIMNKGSDSAARALKTLARKWGL